MKHFAQACIALTLVILLSGCSPVLKAPIGNEGDPRAADQLDHGYAILIDLLSDEAKVSEILAIKSCSPETADILKSISKAAKDGLAKIERLSSEPPVVNPESTGLPLLETDTRNRIANQQTVLLLMAMGSFEVRVLLTQDKACGYASALCESLATSDPNSERSAEMKRLATTFADLGNRVYQRFAVIKSEAGGDS